MENKRMRPAAVLAENRTKTLLERQIDTSPSTG
jgi:hypothetical protein